MKKLKTGMDVRRRMHKKGVIAGALVDVWAMLFFVLVIVIFYFIYKSQAVDATQTIQDKQDVIYGNYLAQVYLRTPLVVEGEHMTVAELIAMYDYNQSLELEQAEDASYAEWAEDLITDNPITYLFGRRNPMREAIVDLTDDFVDNNFDSGRCFTFSIHSDHFDYTQRSSACPGASTFGVAYLFRALDDVPESAYVTYIAPVDPRADPIKVYSIYDMERLLSVYSPDPYFDMDDADRWAVAHGMYRV